MGKRDMIRVTVEGLEGKPQRLKGDGCVLLLQTGHRVGVCMAGEINPIAMGLAMVQTIEKMPAGSDEEDMLLNMVVTVCMEAQKSEKVRDLLQFRADTAQLIRDLLGDEEGGADE